jgi:hypothetical protein
VVSVGSRLDGGLEGLGKTERDPSVRVLACRLPLGGFLRLAHDDELRLATDEANLDLTGRKLGGDVEGRLAQELEQPELKGGAERVSEPTRRLRGRVVAERGSGCEVGLDCGDVRGQLHDINYDIIMASVKCQIDVEGRSVYPFV